MPEQQVIVVTTDNLEQIVTDFSDKTRADLASTVEQRQNRIQQVIDMLVDEQDALTQAISADYQGRCQAFSVMTDVVGSLASLKYTRDNLHKWIEPENCEVIPPYDQMGAQAYTVSQPKGVVGIMGTWNCPLYTVFSPMACALGAGNRVIVKPSDVTPHTAEAIAAAMRKHLDPDVFGVITGDASVSQVFAAQKWDHMVFTGSTATGKKIMAAAAQNLVPVTLELGGKSPAIVGNSANIEEAARRLSIAKGNNSGQICISPDTVYVPKASCQAFCDSFVSTYQAQYPSIENNPDIVPIVNQGHLQRLKGYLDELASSDTQMICTHTDESANDNRLHVTLVIEPAANSKIMQEEIFGPIVIVKTYESLEDVVALLHTQEKPLALYYFGSDKQEQDYVIQHSVSGGVTVNDALTHAALHDAPFGGTGASGMGSYHGKIGYREFSHIRTVFVSPDYDFRGDYGLLPPYTENFGHMMQAQVTKD